MNILVFSEYYLPGYKGGGPIKTISNLANVTSDDFNYFIVTGDRDLGDNASYTDVAIGEWNLLCKSKIFYSFQGVLGFFQIVRIFFNNNFDAVYLNSFFSPRFSLLPLLLSKIINKPVVLGPRGEFSDGALSLKAKRKKVYIFFYKLLRLQENIIFQGSSDFEKKDIKKVFGNVVKICVVEDIGSQEYSIDIPKKDKGIIKIIFLSRVSRMKNINYALEVLKNVSCAVVYDIYGPIEDDQYWYECNEIIKKMPENVSVNYKGFIEPSEVLSTLNKYDLFFMPTKGENYGHVITEALCAGLPILIADTTPWRNLEDEGIGWDISLDKPDKFVSAIERASVMTGEEYQHLRNTVLSWAKAKFSQRSAVEASKEMFRYAVTNKTLL